MGMHDGHRARVRQRVLREGFRHLPPHNVLEVLLFFCMARGDTNPLAHRILDHFGRDFTAVTEASMEELMAIDGVGESTAFFLKMIPEIAAYYRQARVRDGVPLSSKELLQDYLVPIFYGKRNEELHLICLDAAMRPLYDERISEGTSVASEVSIARIVQTAVRHHAARVILVHNHPSGSIRPSTRDFTVTKTVADAMRLVGVELVDHIVVADEDICSIRKLEPALFGEGVSRMQIGEEENG